ncbi:ATP-NAD kinase-like domain-containing protein [Geopyxis carbonaria]|nr:ATP-NAD kinase-like domain-containing protein [Geopyxis carbonaria]
MPPPPLATAAIPTITHPTDLTDGEDGLDSAVVSDDDPLSDSTTFSRDDHVLQIIFDPQLQASRRRKSSLVNLDIPHTSTSTPSSCFVHALLETQKAHSAGASPEPPAIAGCSAAMTKAQLSDMVLGVRELSKHLASLTIRMRVRRVFILTKAADSALVAHTRTVAAWLLAHDYTVYVEDTFQRNAAFDGAALGGGDRLRYWTPELCATRPHTFDFIITLGGDGTVLYASWLFQKVVPPVLSFALGSLGFLTKFDFREHERIMGKHLTAGVTIGLRLRFEGTIMRSLPREGAGERVLADEILDVHPGRAPTHEPAQSSVILNELVVDRGPNPTMSTTELYGDDMFLTSIAADGVCIATPTGSTAYNLAAGGSLCHPELPGMLVSVICAHSLTFRPIILPDSMVIRIGVPYDGRTTAWVSFDGRQRCELRQGDYLSVVASRFPFPVCQDKRDNKDWFDSIRRTMNWGVRTGQKSFG